MNVPLKGKTALISGGASGIGRAGALRFAAGGAAVVIADTDADRGAETLDVVRKSSPESSFVKCDVSSEPSVAELFKFIKNKHGKLDVIYNNASVYLPGRDGRITDIKEENWDRILAVNLKSVFLFCKHGIPLLIERGRGSVINTASSAGMIGIPGCDAYTASKGATVQLTKSMAAEYGQFGVRVNCIAPAAIMTPMMRRSNPENSDFDEKSFLGLRTPLRRYGTPEEVASLALFLASDESSYINGAVIPADGGITINGDLSYPAGRQLTGVNEK
jgi:NAD(P)-dependent dehydrogenase (short-subunit alcohol dehydrogenase family)